MCQIYLLTFIKKKRIKDDINNAVLKNKDFFFALESEEVPFRRERELIYDINVKELKKKENIDISIQCKCNFYVFFLLLL